MSFGLTSRAIGVSQDQRQCICCTKPCQCIGKNEMRSREELIPVWSVGPGNKLHDEPWKLLRIAGSGTSGDDWQAKTALRKVSATSEAYKRTPDSMTKSHLRKRIQFAANPSHLPIPTPGTITLHARTICVIPLARILVHPDLADSRLSLLQITARGSHDSNPKQLSLIDIEQVYIKATLHLVAFYSISKSKSPSTPP